MHRPKLALIAALAVSPIAAGPAAAQNASDIIRTAMEKYEQRMAGIDNYTVVQKTLGTTITTYYEKEMVDGRPVFTSSAVSTGGRQSRAPSAAELSDLSKLAEHARYEGSDDIDGHRTFVISVDRSGMAEWGDALSAGADAGFEMNSMTLYLDAEQYVPRRFVVEGSMTEGNQQRPITSTIELDDYRMVEGLLHPFHTSFRIEGLTGGPNGPSEKELAEAKQQLAEFDEQLANMPESQRAMMERMMGDRIKQLRAMLDAAGPSFDVETTEVRVNQGPPSK